MPREINPEALRDAFGLPPSPVWSDDDHEDADTHYVLLEIQLCLALGQRPRRGEA